MESIKTSPADERRIEFLRLELQVREKELLTILSKYFKYDMKIEKDPARLIKLNNGQLPEVLDLIFLNDGHGHCGVHDERTGTCNSVDC